MSKLKKAKKNTVEVDENGHDVQCNIGIGGLPCDCWKGEIITEDNPLYISCPDCKSERFEIALSEKGVFVYCPKCEEVIDLLHDKRIKEVLEQARLEDIN